MTVYFLTESDLQSRFDLFPELVNQAREITLPLFNDPASQRVVNKGVNGYDPVTFADKEAERILREIIHATFPDDHITGEEFEDIIGTNEYQWTLDPIDGTRAFIAGVPVWSTLIALSRNGQPVLGMIDLPAMGKSYIGGTNEIGEARAFLKTDDGELQEISSSDCSTLKQAIMGCTQPMSMFSDGELAAFNIISAGTRFSRLGLDAFGYGLIAQGRMDIIIEASLKPCDVRALMPIIHGAGGKMTNWHGGPCVDGGRVVAVGDASLLDELYTYLGRALN